MIQSYSEEEIHFKKELNILDKFTLAIVDLLRGINYVIVSGYVAIFFGRTRATEDIDFFIEQISFERFKALAKRVRDAGYWFLNGDDEESLYELLKEGSSLRIANKGLTKPNAEIKFARENTDFFSLKNKVKVIFNGNRLYMSPMSIEIPYKLYLGSDKDFEDARHLYALFEKYLDKKELIYFIKLLKVEKLAEMKLWPKSFQWK